MSDNINLALWESVEKTNPGLTKEVPKGSFKLTAIDTYSRIKRATELWGQCGNKWGVKNEKIEVHQPPTPMNWIYATYSAILFYPGSTEGIPIHSDIEVIYSVGTRKGKYNEDWTKKVATDALTKGLSMLGFNADVYLGMFEDMKYVQERVVEETKKKEVPDTPIKAECRRIANKYMQQLPAEYKSTLRETFSKDGGNVIFTTLSKIILDQVCVGIKNYLNNLYLASKIDKTFLEGQSKLLEIAKTEKEIDNIISTCEKETSK